MAWEAPIAVDEPWTAGFRLAPESIEQIQFSGDFGEYATAGEAVGTLIGQAQIKLAKFTVVETRDVEIEGATTAQVVRYTIIDNANSQLAGELDRGRPLALPAVGRGLDPDPPARPRPGTPGTGLDADAGGPRLTPSDLSAWVAVRTTTHADKSGVRAWVRGWARGPMTGSPSSA